MQTKRPCQGELAGPDQSFGTDDLGPNKTHLSTQRDDPIRVFMPGRTESEYALRARIDRIAVMAATSATRTTHDCARSICWIANDLANDWRIRAATEDELRNVILALTAMLGAARAVERLVDGGEATS